MSFPKVRACLITNPRSGHGGVDLSTVIPILRSHGWEVVIYQKLKGGMATKLAQQAAKEGFDVVVDCGGDGTLSEIVDGLVGTNVAVGTIPGGTVNLWAHELGISSRLDIAALQLVGSVRKRIDVGEVTINGKHPQHFVLMAGLGLDGAIMAAVSKPLKNRIGTMAVGLAALKTLPFHKAQPVRIQIGEMQWLGSTTEIIIGNTRRYGGFTRFTPDALVDDGLMDVCLLTSHGPLGIFRQAASLLFKQQPDLRGAELYRAGIITIVAPQSVPLQLDGGVVMVKDKPTPEGMIYNFTLISQGVTMLVPANYDGELFQKINPTPLTLSSPIEIPKPNQPKKGQGNEIKSWKKRQMRVLEVGVDSITVFKLKDGKVIRIILGPDTTIQNSDNKRLEVMNILAYLDKGDLLHISGPKGSNKRIILAEKITILRKSIK